MLTRDQASKGMVVRFGRPNGMKARGEITYVGKRVASVKLLEKYGNGKGCMPGSKWKVPYDLMELISTTNDGSIVADQVQPVPAIKKTPIPNTQDNMVFMRLISQCYGQLSPENLTCDGELPRHLVNQRRAELQRKLRAAFAIIGREVGESEVYEWLEEKRKESAEPLKVF